MALRKSIIASAVVVAIAGILVGTLVARANEKPAAGSTPPPPATVTFDQDEWTIETPSGWTQKDDANADAKKAVRYEGPDGEYFIVAIDPLGSGYSYDGLWTYGVDGNGFEVVARADCTGGIEMDCSTNDDRYSGYIMWKTGSEPRKVGGHLWYFMFGDTDSTTVDATVFEQILESITVKA